MKDWTGNSNSIFKTLGASNHTDKEREKDDYYATDPIAIDLLLMKEKPSENVWECACGEGHMAKKLEEHGYKVFCTDLVDRGYGLGLVDFLKFNAQEEFYGDIITNPPYKFAKDFVLKALELLKEGHKCYMLLKLTFLEGIDRYKELFSKYPPKMIYGFPKRVMCAKNGEFERMKAGGGSAVAYAWFVWEKGYTGLPRFDWLYEDDDLPF